MRANPLWRNRVGYVRLDNLAAPISTRNGIGATERYSVTASDLGGRCCSATHLSDSGDAIDAPFVIAGLPPYNDFEATVRTVFHSAS